MGMDVHGLNPKQNKNIKDFPILAYYKNMEFEKKWNELEKNKEKRKQYWKEKDKFNASNPGVYFENTCWWWRPLWDYCFVVAPDIISDELWNLGHGNNGAGLDDEGAKALGNVLMEHIANGHTILYQEDFEKDEKDYTFDVDNVEAFAKFCLECGGFEIQ